VADQLHTSADLTPAKRAGTYCTRDRLMSGKIGRINYNTES